LELSVRPQVFTLPSYSLTGDLLGFLRCGLQYRYSRLGNLPASNPIQLWFGEFIHGVMEEAFRHYRVEREAGRTVVWPWEEEVVEHVLETIRKRLASRGLEAWNDDDLERGRKRARVAIQELGPHLFPLISRPEVAVRGARVLPDIPAVRAARVSTRYEMSGVIDVVTHVELADPAMAGNPLVQLILGALPGLHETEFEIIVDYKGARRPPTGGGPNGKPSLWQQYAWQVQTYAELREKQPGSGKVVAGIVLYVNELSPLRSDFEALRSEVRTKTTDVPPEPGSPDEKALFGPLSSSNLPALSFAYRLRRAVRLVPVTGRERDAALKAFDDVVGRIELCRVRETQGASILSAWERNPSDESTCTVCDHRTFCPDYRAGWGRKNRELEPRLPGVKVGAARGGE
jgi:hypothetical protein